MWFYGKKKEPGRSVPAKPGTGVFSLVHSWALQEHRLDCADSWRSRLSRRAPFLLHNCYMSRQPGQLCSLSAPFLLHRVQQPEPLRQRRTRSWNIKEMSDIACGYWQLLVLFLTVTMSYKAEAMFDIVRRMKAVLEAKHLRSRPIWMSWVFGNWRPESAPQIQGLGEAHYDSRARIGSTVPVYSTGKRAL